MKRLPWILVVLCVFIGILPGQAPARQLVYQRQAVTDPQGFQMEVLHMLVPRGWTFQGQVLWNTRVSPPVPSLSLEAVSKDGRSRLTLAPEQAYFWSQDPGLQQSWSRMGTEILQPMRAAEYIARVYLPRSRGQADVLETTPLQAAAENARRINEYHMQVFHQISPFTFPFQLGADAARVKARFTHNGQEWEEEITTTVHYMEMALASPYGFGSIPAVSWRTETFSFLAPASHMQEQAGHLRVMLNSLTPNPAWALANVKLAATVTRERIQAQQAWFNAMQRVRQSQLEVSDMIARSYEDRSAAYDRIFDNYSLAVRSVDAYADPISNRQVELPNGYGHAWTNGDTYILSDDANFDPNIGSTQGWERMKRRE